jgi:uncharacterized Zn finger protein
MDSEKTNYFIQLKLADLHAWAGEVICGRGRTYQKDQRVQDLAYTANGGLVASVLGAETYVTTVDVENERLTSTCTCPYDSTCKHAVAVILEYLERIKRKIDIPVAPGTNKRLLPHEPVRGRVTNDKSGETGNTELLKSYLNKQNKKHLVHMIESLADRHPEVREFLDDQLRLSTGKVDNLVESLKRKIITLSSEPAWVHHWDNEGYIPDYSEVKHRFESLLSKGFADKVVELGKILFDKGTHQVEESEDEGETADQIASCMKVVFEALSRSSLSPSEQMLWAIDCELYDNYDLCAESDTFWEIKYKASDWNIIANKLTKQLKALKPPKDSEDFSNYRRDTLTDWIILAMDNAGRNKEIIPLCEQEAEVTGNYVRLVNRLIQEGREGMAEEWIRKGIKSLDRHSQGIGAQLRDILYEMKKKAKDWPMVTALDADAFFVHPGFTSFDRLRLSAERAKVWPEVREAVMQYLENGDLPQPRRGQEKTIWPLPETGLRGKMITGSSEFPIFGTLIDIAIAEKRTVDILRWYDQSYKSRGGMWRDAREDKVAQAISSEYPNRAIDIWKTQAETYIRHTQPNAYVQAAIYLEKVQRTLKKTGRQDEWQSYVVALRSANLRKKKLIEIMDRLNDKPIIDTSTLNLSQK